MKQYILNNPTLVAVMITLVLIVVIAWNDPYEKKQLKIQKANREPLRYPHTKNICSDAAMIYDLMLSAVNKKHLESIRNMMDTFQKTYGNHPIFQELYQDLVNEYNTQVAHMDYPNLSSEYVPIP